MEIENLTELVIQEATKLKPLLTPEEKGRLDFSTLRSDSLLRCIYGQCTGNCYSTRAQELIQKCCEIVFDDIQNPDAFKVDGYVKRESFDDDTRYSPIEVFIHIQENKENGNNEALVAFLKGETKTLDLK